MTLTATLIRIDPPPPAMTEAALMRAYSRANPRSERCVCGGWPISVGDETDSAEIARAIDVHSVSTAHQLWRRREGL